MRTASAGFWILLSACTPATSTPGSTPSESVMPHSLDCQLVRTQRIRSGPTWRSLTIGQSTLADVQAELVTPQSDRVDFDYEHSIYVFYNDASPLNSDRGIVKVCLADNTLAALNISGPDDLPMTLDEAIEEYGNPDRVTWGEDYYTRSLIWASRGTLMVVDVSSEIVVRVILFSPIPQRKLDSSWLLAALPDRGFTHPGGDAPSLSGRQILRDPWEIGR